MEFGKQERIPLTLNHALICNNLYQQHAQLLVRFPEERPWAVLPECEESGPVIPFEHFLHDEDVQIFLELVKKMVAGFKNPTTFPGCGRYINSAHICQFFRVKKLQN